MLQSINVIKLFGIFDYKITMKPDGVTILTGPNGFGKSTLLKCIDAMYRGDILFFSRLDFEEIEFVSDSIHTSFKIRKNEGELYINDVEVQVKSISDDVFRRAIRRPYLMRVDEDRWIDRRNDIAYSREELIQNYLNESIVFRIPTENEDEDSQISISLQDISKEMRELVGNTKFIKEQRLIIERWNHRDDKLVINTIDELPKRFKDRMYDVSSKYSAMANSLDSSYPSKLFSTTNGITKDEYIEKLKSMNEKFEKLTKYDISDMKVLSEVAFEEQHAKALKVYFEHFEKKYDVFKDFVYQLELFTEIVNSRLKFKEIRITREDGIAVYKKHGTQNKLSLNQLSSGEKQEIVLFYELIFEIEQNVHLLIDEPEISLHIEWQLKFMDDLLRIADYKNVKVTVATHSPQIISNHWDIQIDLGEMYGK